MKNLITLLLIALFVCSCSGSGSSTSSSQASTEEVLFSSTEGTPENVVYGGGPIDWPATRLFKLPLTECDLLFDFGRPNPAFGNQIHLGQDFDAPELSDLFSIGDGQIVFSTFREGAKNWGGIFVLQVEYPEQFYVIYGHVDKDSLPAVGATAVSGKPISKLEKYGVHAWNKPHLHLQLGKGRFFLPSGRLSPPGYADSTEGWENPLKYLSQYSSTSATPSVPIAEAAVSFSPSGPFYGYDTPITVTRGQSVSLYFSADKDVNRDGKASLDPNGWSDPNSGVSSGGKAEWNTDLNQGSPSFEEVISNPATVSDANIGPITYTFNDNPGVYEYQVLRITDRNGLSSMVSRIRVNVVQGPDSTPNSQPIAEAAVSFSPSGPFYGYDNPITITRGQPVNLYFSADKDVNGDGKASLDPNGWTDVTNGVSSGGKAEWNTDLNQGSPTFEETIANPSNAGAANIGPRTYTFNDTPGIYEYQVLNITDRNGSTSETSRIRVNVVAPAVGYASVSDGIKISGSPVRLGQDFKISFTLKEMRGAPKYLDEVAIRVTDPDGGWFDFNKFSGVTIPAFSTKSLEFTNYVYTSRPAGTYTAEIWGHIGDEWFSFDTTGSGTNPKNFSVIP